MLVGRGEEAVLLEELPQALTPTANTSSTAPRAQSILASLIGSLPPLGLCPAPTHPLPARRHERGVPVLRAPLRLIDRSSVSRRPASRLPRTRPCTWSPSPDRRPRGSP